MNVMLLKFNDASPRLPTSESKSLKVRLFDKRLYLVRRSLSCSCSLSALAIRFSSSSLIFILFSCRSIVMRLTEGAGRVQIVEIEVLCQTVVLCGRSHFNVCCAAHILDRGECAPSKPITRCTCRSGPSVDFNA